VLLAFALQLYAKSATIAPLYGALALLPLVLLWLWLTWVIVLFGLEVSYALQTLPERDLADQQRSERAEQLVDTRAVVPIMACVGEAFSRGDSLTLHEVGVRLGLPDPLVDRVLGRLLEENLLHRVMDPDQAYPRFTLARPPERISVQRLLDTGTRMTVSKLTAGSVPGASTLHRLNEAVASAAADTTLAHVIDAESEAGEAEQDPSTDPEDPPSRT
jgi:membrane protein